MKKLIMIAGLILFTVIATAQEHKGQHSDDLVIWTSRFASGSYNGTTQKYEYEKEMRLRVKITLCQSKAIVYLTDGKTKSAYRITEKLDDTEDATKKFTIDKAVDDLGLKCKLKSVYRYDDKVYMFIVFYGGLVLSYSTDPK